MCLALALIIEHGLIITVVNVWERADTVGKRATIIYGHAVCEASTEFKGCTFAMSTVQPPYSTSNCTGVLLHGCKSPTHRVTYTLKHLHHVLGLYNGSTSRDYAGSGNLPVKYPIVIVFVMFSVHVLR